VIIGTLPFVVTLVLMMVVLSVFPDLALMLPRAAAN
jgi:TRAP-type mannitol/chloroaromatic compound transport system permease large subunit